MSAFVERIKDHLDEAEVIREGLCHEGPGLILALQDRGGWGNHSLRSVARETGVSAGYLSKVMNGREILSPERFLKLASYL
jgi:hypothetical protein